MQIGFRLRPMFARDAEGERKHSHGPSSVAVMPRVSGFSGAAPRKLDPVWASVYCGGWTVKPGFFSNWRKANRRSLNMTDRISEGEIFNEYSAPSSDDSRSSQHNSEN